MTRSKVEFETMSNVEWAQRNMTSETVNFGITPFSYDSLDGRNDKE